MTANNTLIDTHKSLRVLLLWVCALVTCEWLFFATKPSFLHQLTLAGKVVAWLVACLICIVLISLAVTSLRFVLQPFGRWGERLVWLASGLAGAMIVVSTAMLLIDNFTYTLWGFGIRTIEFKSVARLVFGCYFIALLLLLGGLLKKPRPVIMIPAWLGSPVLVLTIFLAVFNGWIPLPWTGKNISDGSQRNLPNIVLLSADGVEASHLSVYGYQRNTTPFLLEKQSEFMVVESNYSNSDRSAGSVSSVLTGKYPTTTGLFSDLDKLNGKDQFEHLPAILTAEGYRSLNMSIRRWVDPADQGFMCGFEQSNHRRLPSCGAMPEWYRLVLGMVSTPIHLIHAIEDRVSERLAILNPFDSRPMYDITWLRWGEEPGYWTNDQSRVDEILAYLESAHKGPLFIHTHLLSSHGPNYFPTKQRFSRGEQNYKWQDDFYDEALLDIDGYISRIYSKLVELGQLESTVVVVTSDHGRNFSTHTPVPLLVRFPNSEFSGELNGPSQRLDIAPTLLDYAEIAIPGWMEGRSLLSRDGADESDNYIFQSDTIGVDALEYPKAAGVTLDPRLSALGALSVIQCDSIFNWNLKGNTWSIQPQPDAPNSCSSQENRNPRDLLHKAAVHLIERGYSTETIEHLINKTRKVDSSAMKQFR